MKVFTGEIPSNPYPEILHCMGEDSDTVFNPEYEAWNECMQSILTQLQDIDINRAYDEYKSFLNTPDHNSLEFTKDRGLFIKPIKSFEEYIQEVKP